MWWRVTPRPREAFGVVYMWRNPSGYDDVVPGRTELRVLLIYPLPNDTVRYVLDSCASSPLNPVLIIMAQLTPHAMARRRAPCPPCSRCYSLGFHVEAIRCNRVRQWLTYDSLTPRMNHISGYVRCAADNVGQVRIPR